METSKGFPKEEGRCGHDLELGWVRRGVQTEGEAERRAAAAGEQEGGQGVRLRAAVGEAGPYGAGTFRLRAAESSRTLLKREGYPMKETFLFIYVQSELEWISRKTFCE